MLEKTRTAQTAWRSYRVKRFKLSSQKERRCIRLRALTKAFTRYSSRDVCYSCDLLLFFFFQAEDGIRDVAVTGVQTCALPIYRRRSARCADLARADEEGAFRVPPGGRGARGAGRGGHGRAVPPQHHRGRAALGGGAGDAAAPPGDRTAEPGGVGAREGAGAARRGRRAGGAGIR